MRIGRLLILGLALAGSLGLGSAFVRGCGHDLADGPLSRNYSRRPPEQAYERAFNRKVPEGVSELRAAGESWPGGTNVWIRFRASPLVIEDLVGRYEPRPASKEAIADHLKQWDPAKDSRTYDPNNRLRWSELSGVRKPEAFLVERGESGHYRTEGWLDRETNNVFIFIFGI